MTVNINNKEIELRQTIRSMMLFENITGSTFKGTGLTDVLTFFYCVVVTSTRDYNISYDSFIDYIDEHTEKLNEFADWVKSTSQNQNELKKE